MSNNSEITHTKVSCMKNNVQNRCFQRVYNLHICTVARFQIFSISSFDVILWLTRPFCKSFFKSHITKTNLLITFYITSYLSEGSHLVSDLSVPRFLHLQKSPSKGKTSSPKTSYVGQFRLPNELQTIKNLIL